METKLVSKMEVNTVSSLAEGLSEVKASKPKSPPRASCFPLYGECDEEDFTAVQRLRQDQVTWMEIQRIVDDLLNISEDSQINNRRFIRHWKGECSCW
ncbi:MAG: hypothetical protein E6R04_00170 [Spirochaetes bacterium]|nr:MAG: hypothetical protein E6R04_00170 [Spirochaetota bacterium]